MSGLTSCNKPSQGQSASAEITREGRTLIPTGLRYSDLSPTISDDGERIVYISGRGSEGEPVLKSYKLTWSGGSKPGSSSRVTSDDVGYEREAVISPDGQWVLLASLKDNQVDVYLQSFVGSAGAVKVTSTDSVEPQLSFSPDSRLVAWLSTDATTGSTTVKIAKIGSGTDSDLSTSVDLPAGSDHIDQFFWLPTEIGSAKPYVLVTASASTEVSGASDLNRFQFATFGDIAGTSSATWLKGIRITPSLRPALKASRTVLVEQVVDSAAQAPQRGTGAQSNPGIYAPLKSAPIFVDVAEAKVLERFGYVSGASNPPPGFDVRSVALSSDSSEALVLSGVFYRCAGDSSDQFGTSFGWMKSDTSQPYSLFNPRVDLGTATDPSSTIQEAYTFAATDLCSNRQGSDGRSSRIDDQIVSFALNGQATSSTYRVVYVTRSTTKLDSTCNLSAGDTEVWALNFDSTGGTFYPVSNNRDPAVLKGNTLVQGACRL
jgi:hypothetical protein